MRTQRPPTLIGKILDGGLWISGFTIQLILFLPKAVAVILLGIGKLGMDLHEAISTAQQAVTEACRPKFANFHVSVPKNEEQLKAIRQFREHRLAELAGLRGSGQESELADASTT